MDTLLATDLTTRLWLLLHSCGLELLVLMVKASVLLIICHWCISQLQRSSAEIRHLSWLCFFFSLALLLLGSILIGSLAVAAKLLPVFEFSISGYPAISISDQLQQLISQSSTNTDIVNHDLLPVLANIDKATQLNHFTADDINAASYHFSSIAILAVGYIFIVACKLCRFVFALYQLRGLTNRATYAYQLQTINNIDHQQSQLPLLKALALKTLSLTTLNRRIKVYTSHEISSAMTWRAIKPCILLPYQAYSWDEQTIKSVIAHELAHIKRNDWLTLSFAKLVSIIFFPVPFLHRAFLQTSLEAESSADNQVISQCQTTTDYAQSLVQIAKGANTPNYRTSTHIKTHKRIFKIIKTNEFALSYAIGIKGSSELGTRISRIIEPIAIRAPIHSSHKISSIFFTVCFVTPLAVIQPVGNIFESASISIPVVFANKDSLNDKRLNTGDKATTIASMQNQNSIHNSASGTKKITTADQQLSSIADLISHARLITPPNIHQIKEQGFEFNEANQPIELHAITSEAQASFYHAVYDIDLPSHQSIETEKQPVDTVNSRANPKTAIALFNAVPKYPKRAVRNGIEGEVHAIYNVENNGQASDIVIVSSKPKIIFDKAVVTAIRNSRFVATENTVGNNIAINSQQPIEKVLFEQTYLFRLSDDKQKFTQQLSQKNSKPLLEIRFETALEKLPGQSSEYRPKQIFGFNNINSS